MRYLVKLDSVSIKDQATVGGKNASTGELLQNLGSKGINIPNGYATKTQAYDEFIVANNLKEKIISILASLNAKNILELNRVSKQIQKWINAGKFSADFIAEVKEAYTLLNRAPVAVRSSATAEDLASASFAGQQESFLNVRGEKQLLHAIKMVFASLFTSRAIAYRAHHGFDIEHISISVGIQPMVRSDRGASGVIFTLDTESGFDKVVLITGSYGLGEALVLGKVNPDEFIVSKEALKANKFAILQKRLGDKKVKMVYANKSLRKHATKIVKVKESEREQFCLTNDEIKQLAEQALIIEKHYQKPMDIEWAKDGLTGKFFIVQARPETVKSQQDSQTCFKSYEIKQKGKVLASGQSIGQGIGTGKARIILDAAKMHEMEPGDILITDMTDPDWEPILKHASAIVTNRGGRTCHAAIIARELGIPSVVGCNNATKAIKNGESVTVSCAEGQIGYIYQGILSYDVTTTSIDNLGSLPVKLCINLGNPEKAFITQFLPNNGVGLARLEFIISNAIGVHPKALLEINTLPKKVKKTILKKTAAYESPVEFYIEKLREGIATIAAAFYPKHVIFRFSDFKSNEYRNLLGGNYFEPNEENPMIGFRGASRYKSEHFRESFALECEAFKRVRNQMGLTNAQVMVPFVRTVNELKEVIELLESLELKREKNGLKIYMMCEVPSNALLANEFLNYVDGFSIGSNDLTQLTLGVDRDSSLLASQFDENNEAVKVLIHLAISECLRQGKYIGICGQGASDNVEFAKWLMQEGIQHISLNPDSIIRTWLMLANQKGLTLVSN